MLTLTLVIMLVIWTTADPKWHKFILGALALVLCLFGAWLWRRKQREAAEERPHILPSELWRWTPTLDAETFRGRCEIFLKSRSWHIVTANAPDAETLRVIAQKDRLRVAMHFAKSQAPPDIAILRSVAAFQREAGASQAGFISEMKYPQASRVASSETSVSLLHFADLEGIDKAFSAPP